MRMKLFLLCDLSHILHVFLSWFLPQIRAQPLASQGFVDSVINLVSPRVSCSWIPLLVTKNPVGLWALLLRF